MANWYKQSQAEHSYVAPVEVNIYGGYTSIQDYVAIEPLNKSINVPFRIDIGARQWGIKSMTVLVYEQIDIPIQIMTVDEQGNDKEAIDKTVSVDLSKVATEDKHGSGMVTLGSLDLYLDANLNVDYGKSSLTVIK